MAAVESEGKAQGVWAERSLLGTEDRLFQRIAIRFLLGGSMGFFAILALTSPEHTGTVLGQGPLYLALMTAIAWNLLRQGKDRAAGLLLILGIWAYATIVSFFDGGLSSVNLYFYPPIIVLAAWRLGIRFGHLLTGASAAVCIVLYLVEAKGMLPAAPPLPPLLRLLVEIAIFAFCGIVVRALVRSYRDRLNEVGKLGAELAASAAEVRAREVDLNRAQSVAQIGSWTYDLATRSARLSPEASRLLGLRERDTIRPDDFAKMVHPDDLQGVTEAWREARAGRAPFKLDHRILVDGETLWVREVADFAPDASGRSLPRVGTVQNISERKRIDAELEGHRRHLEELVQQRTDELLATEARASLILQSSADGLYGVDAHGLVSFINPAACRILGYESGQVIGRSAHELFHHTRADGSPYPATECPGRLSVRKGQSIRIDNEVYWCADGRSIPVMYASHPMIEKGEVTGAVISFVDMSVQHAAAAAREQALIAAENLARTRSEFLANMSHEIRTPMNGVLGFAQIGLRSHLDGDKARNAFEKILASGNQLLGVVNEILDFSRIDAGKLPIEATEMSLLEVIDHALDNIADRARAKGLELRLEIAPGFPTRCVGDPVRLGQVLLNLLSNAVKFTETGRIDLSASRRNEVLVFRVADTGIGMTEDQLAFIFNPFHQADSSTTRKFGGTGLGLAICKRLLELMHGEIRVESRPGTGSSFEFSLPYVEPKTLAAEGAATRSALPDKPLAGISILVAEDDKVNQLMLEANLIEDGAQLVMVGDGREAVDRIVADGPGAYDIVLMDVQMPVMDGYEATRRILELAPDLPVVGQTAHALDEDRDRCLAAGMIDHIAKPIDAVALVKLVRRVVAARRKAS